jgi:hypothetical protein
MKIHMPLVNFKSRRTCSRRVWPLVRRDLRAKLGQRVEFAKLWTAGNLMTCEHIILSMPSFLRTTCH